MGTCIQQVFAAVCLFVFMTSPVMGQQSLTIADATTQGLSAFNTEVVLQSTGDTQGYVLAIGVRPQRAHGHQRQCGRVRCGKHRGGVDRSGSAH